jgi:hypothetical protein
VFDEDPKIPSSRITIHYSDSFCFRFFPDFKTPEKWREILNLKFSGGAAIRSPQLNFSTMHIGTLTCSVPPQTLPAIPIKNDGALQRLKENVFTATDANVEMSRSMSLVQSLSMCLFGRETDANLLETALNQELEENQPYFHLLTKAFLLPGRMEAIQPRVPHPLLHALAFTRLTQCQLVILCADRLGQTSLKTVIHLDFAATTFPSKTYGIACLSPTEFFAVTPNTVVDAEPEPPPGRVKSEPSLRFTNTASRPIRIDIDLDD